MTIETIETVASGAGGIATVLGWFAALPPALWLALPSLPLVAGAIGFATAQGTVR